MRTDFVVMDGATPIFVGSSKDDCVRYIKKRYNMEGEEEPTDFVEVPGNQGLYKPVEWRVAVKNNVLYIKKVTSVLIDK